MRCFPAFALLLMLGGDAAAQRWGTNGCSPVGPSLNTASRTWQVPADDPGRVYLYVDGRLAGGYCSRSGLYLEWTGRDWGRDWQSPPADVPASFVTKDGKGVLVKDTDPVTQNYGVNLKELKKQEPETFTLNGRPSDREEVMQALVASVKLSDDRAKVRLTVIGPKVDCERALADLPADLKDKWLVQCYRPGDWAVAQAGFMTAGTPTIYLQQAPNQQTGLSKVLWRQDSYATGDWGAVRKADPSYKPDKDPGPNNQPVLPSLPDLLPLLAKIPAWAWVLLSVGALWFLNNRFHFSVVRKT